MDLNSARQFVAVVDAGSFRKAATLLATSVSTLSERIAQLERELGIALFVRTTRRLSVTEAGKELYDSCVGAVAAMAEAAERVSGRGITPSGTLRITAPSDFAESALVSAIRAYQQVHTNVRVETVLTNRYVDLIAERYDVAVRGGQLVNSGLIAKRVGVGTLVLVASPTYAMAAATLRHPRDLAQHDCVGFVGEGVSRAAEVWQLRSDAGARCNVRPRFKVASSSFAMAIKHVQYGAGVGLFPFYMVKGHLADGNLVRVLSNWATSPIPVHILVPELRVPSLKTKDMVRLLHEHLQPLFRETESPTKELKGSARPASHRAHVRSQG